MSLNSPRRFWQRSMIAPTYSGGAMMLALANGSSASAISAGIGVVERGVDVELRAVGLGDLVDDVGRGGDEVEVIFPLQPLQDDLHVQKPQKAAAEAEAQRDGVFLRRRSWTRR